jgi:hypothetical protein
VLSRPIALSQSPPNDPNAVGTVPGVVLRSRSAPPVASRTLQTSQRTRFLERSVLAERTYTAVPHTRLACKTKTTPFSITGITTLISLNENTFANALVLLLVEELTKNFNSFQVS